MSDDVVVRAGTEDDRPFVLDLGGRTMLDSVASFREAIPALLSASYEGLLEFCYAQSHLLFIADRGAERAGFLLLLTALPDEVTRMPQGFVAYMAVEPRFRRYGIGKQMLAAAETAARERGLPYMGLMVTEENEAAMALYRGAGFLVERRLLCKPL